MFQLHPTLAPKQFWSILVSPAVVLCVRFLDIRAGNAL